MQQGMILRPMSLSELLDASFGLYRRHFVPLVFVAIASQAIPLGVGVYVEVAGGVLEHPVAWLLGVVGTIVLGQLGIATSTFMVAEAYLGGSTTPMESFTRSQRYLGRLLGAAFASGLLTFIAFLFLIVPGFIVFCGLALTTPALVLEDCPSATAAMRRSFDLTKGFRGKVFAAYLVAFLLIGLPSLALGTLGVAAAATSAASISVVTIVFMLVQTVLQVLAYPFLYVITTLLYYDLRVRKEAYDLEMLSSSLGAP